MTTPPVSIAAAAMAGDGSLLQGELRLAGRLDPRFFDLLRALDLTGSLHKAARTAGYSYKGAWLVLEHAGRLAREPLVASAAGGRGGGGSRLTPAARQLMAAWQALQQRHQDFLRAEEAWLLEQPGIATLLKRRALKSTARNQFAGAVTGIDDGPVTSVVTLGLGGRQEISAAVGSTTVARLGLAPGQPALAVVEAADVTLVTDASGWRLGARNQLDGAVARIERGAASALVGLMLPGGATVTARVTAEAVDELGLVVGQPASATFEAHAVLLAAAG